MIDAQNIALDLTSNAMNVTKYGIYSNTAI